MSHRILLFSCIALAACAPELGDGCADSLECALDGTRICDSTQPGGYCLIPGCRADECPEEGVCVAFGRDELARTFCMRHCSGDGDCRTGYECVDPSPPPDQEPEEPPDPAPAYTEIVDEFPEGSRFCTVTSS